MIFSMTFFELRNRHPRLIYDNFDLSEKKGNLQISFSFILEPDIVFSPKVSIPMLGHDINLEEISGLVFNLGLVEALSYWKSACPPEMVVKAGHLTEQQTVWWHDLFIHGLGEFFFQNDIDFTQPDFFSISSGDKEWNRLPAQSTPLSGDLLMVGGGKDSVVTLETLKDTSERKNAFMLNPNRNSLDSARLAGFKNPVAIKRTIDSKLLDLNKEGYLNGHTPFSAYLAFLGILVAYLHGFKHIISSNELSSGEENLIFHGIKVNHQYSKSYRFEKLFREYSAGYLTGDVGYFSFLRPLFELQIARLFSKYSRFDNLFISCNVNKGESWCGHCPKCAFAYLSLFPFMEDDRLKKIFGSDLFEQPEIQRHILDLTGLGPHKPFDCVGTKEESVVAIALAIKKYQANHNPIPNFLLSLRQKLNFSDEDIKQASDKLMANWSNENFLPPEYARLLKERIFSLKK